MPNVAEIKGKRFMPKVADAVFKMNGTVAFIAKANTDAQVAIEATQEEIKAGQTNATIGVVTSETSIDVTFSTPEWQPEFLAANVGSTIAIGSYGFTVTSNSAQVDASGNITLPAVPYDSVIQLEKNGGYIKVTATTTTVNLSAYGFTEGDCASYIAVFTESGKRITLSTEAVPYTGELVLTSPIFEGSRGKIGNAEYVFPAFTLSGSWTHKFGSDASYEISGKPSAVSGASCGEGESYGYYQEYITDDTTLTQYTTILASPNDFELDKSDSETQQIEVYGSKGDLYEKTQITSSCTFALEAGSDQFIAVTSGGLVSTVAPGIGYVTASYDSGAYTARVKVTVVA